MAMEASPGLSGFRQPRRDPAASGVVPRLAGKITLRLYDLAGAYLANPPGRFAVSGEQVA